MLLVDLLNTLKSELIGDQIGGILDIAHLISSDTTLSIKDKNSLILEEYSKVNSLFSIINQGMNEIYKEFNLKEKNYIITLNLNQKEYKIPNDCMKIKKAYDNSAKELPIDNTSSTEGIFNVAPFLINIPKTANNEAISITYLASPIKIKEFNLNKIKKAINSNPNVLYDRAIDVINSDYDEVNPSVDAKFLPFVDNNNNGYNDSEEFDSNGKPVDLNTLVYYHGGLKLELTDTYYGLIVKYVLYRLNKSKGELSQSELNVENSFMRDYFAELNRIKSLGLQDSFNIDLNKESPFRF